MKDPIFFRPAQSFTLKQIAALTGAKLRNDIDGEKEIDGVASLVKANENSLVYINDVKYKENLNSLCAGALLCSQSLASYVPLNQPVLVTESPYKDFITISRLLYPSALMPQSLSGETGISKKAFVDDSAIIESGAIIEPNAIIGKNVEIGTGTIISPNTVIGNNCKIGRNCFIGANVTLQCSMLGNYVHVQPGAQIGQDGFGYISTETDIAKVPQIGRVIIQDNVDIGANTTIDRGGLDDTIIGEGTKIDNLVQIAHNVRIGRYCIIAAHSGISGSVTIGDRSVLGGRVGIKDHVTIGSYVQIAAASGVMRDIGNKEKWGGIPARPVKQWFREITILNNISKSKRKRSYDGE